MLFKRKSTRQLCECEGLPECEECGEVQVPEEEKSHGKFYLFCMKIGKRNLAIAASVLLIGAAVFLNWMLFANPADEDGYPNYDQPTSLEGDQQNAPVVDECAVYFSTTQVSRQKARDEAIEVLQSVVDNVDAAEELKAEAVTGISAIADEIQKEATMESLIQAKGFDQCLAVMSGSSVNIIVHSEEDLLPAQIAQIKEIVYSQTGLIPTIINK